MLSHWPAKVCDKVYSSPGMISSLYKYLLLLKDKHENPRNEERAIGPCGVAVLEENSFGNVRDSDTPALSAGAEEKSFSHEGCFLTPCVPTLLYASSIRTVSMCCLFLKFLQCSWERLQSLLAALQPSWSTESNEVRNARLQEAGLRYNALFILGFCF